MLVLVVMMVRQMGSMVVLRVDRRLRLLGNCRCPLLDRRVAAYHNTAGVGQEQTALAHKLLALAVALPQVAHAHGMVEPWRYRGRTEFAITRGKL